MSDGKEPRKARHGSIDTDKLDTHTVVHELNRFLKSVTSMEVQLIEDVNNSQSNSLSSDLKQLGYIVTHVRVSGGGEGVTCFHNLRHNYLSVFMPGDAERYIVDPLFKDQFVIAHPTERYSSLLACIPSTLILPEDHMEPLVAFICKEMTAAFKTTQTEIPPWRKLTSMLTKWPGKENNELQDLRRRSRDQLDSAPKHALKPNLRQYGGFSLLSQALGHLAT